jgi:hypothetical protein
MPPTKPKPKPLPTITIPQATVDFWNEIIAQEDAADEADLYAERLAARYGWRR